MRRGVSLKRDYEKLIEKHGLEKFTAVVCQMPGPYQTAIRGCLANKTQVDLAAELSITQSRVSKMLRRSVVVINQALSTPTT